jgi:hypothetical protein
VDLWPNSLCDRWTRDSTRQTRNEIGINLRRQIEDGSIGILVSSKLFHIHLVQFCRVMLTLIRDMEIECDNDVMVMSDRIMSTPPLGSLRHKSSLRSRYDTHGTRYTVHYEYFGIDGGNWKLLPVVLMIHLTISIK